MLPGMHVAPWFALALLAAACSPPTPDAGARTAPAPAVDAATPIATTVGGARMGDHFGDALKIKDAVIAGELADVRAPAQRLVERVTPDQFPPAWQPHVEASARHAAAALAAADIDAASRAAAGLAEGCGACHAAIGGGPELAPVGPAPAAGPDDPPKVQMLRHQWAADRMWEALISRGDARWQAGAAALADAPLGLAAITADVELPEEVQQLGDRVHALGRQAGTVAGWDERAAIYGEFMAACATCHKGGC